MGLAEKQSLLDALQEKFAAGNKSQERGNDNDTFVEGIFAAEITDARIGETEDGMAYGVYNFTVAQPGSENNGKRGTEWSSLEHPVGFEIFMTSLSRAGLDCSNIGQLCDLISKIMPFIRID